MSQTVVPALVMSVAVPGQHYQPEDGALIDTAFNQESANPMAFGIIVARGTVADSVIQTAGATDVLGACGVVMHSHAYSRSTDGTNATGELAPTGILPKGHINLLRRGRIYITTEQALVRGDRDLRVRHTSGAGGTVIGALRKTAVANETMKLGGTAECIVGAAAGAVAVVEFDFMNGVGTIDT